MYRVDNVGIRDETGYAYEFGPHSEYLRSEYFPISRTIVVVFSESVFVANSGRSKSFNFDGTNTPILLSELHGGLLLVDFVFGSRKKTVSVFDPRTLQNTRVLKEIQSPHIVLYRNSKIVTYTQDAIQVYDFNARDLSLHGMMHEEVWNRRPVAILDNNRLVVADKRRRLEVWSVFMGSLDFVKSLNIVVDLSEPFYFGVADSGKIFGLISNGELVCFDPNGEIVYEQLSDDFDIVRMGFFQNRLWVQTVSEGERNVTVLNEGITDGDVFDLGNDYGLVLK
jgi:hypothetical protein